MWTVTSPDQIEFAHYGVKGMKWGVRKEYEPKGRKLPSTKMNKQIKSNNRLEQKEKLVKTTERRRERHF